MPSQTCNCTVNLKYISLNRLCGNLRELLGLVQYIKNQILQLLAGCPYLTERGMPIGRKKVLKLSSTESDFYLRSTAVTAVIMPCADGADGYGFCRYRTR